MKKIVAIGSVGQSDAEVKMQRKLFRCVLFIILLSKRQANTYRKLRQICKDIDKQIKPAICIKFW